jgi:hypothetical protein
MKIFDNGFFVTSFNRKLYNEYAHSFIETYLKTDQTIPVLCFVEDNSIFIEHPNFTFINLFEVEPELVKFLERHKKPKLENNNFLQDATRFCFKVFAQYNASKLKKKFVWLDADNVFMSKIPHNFIDSFLPNEIFTTFYGRYLTFTECGIVGFNCNLPVSKKFFEVYVSHYTKDLIWGLIDKTDCHAFDNTRRMVNVPERNKDDGQGGHIIARDKEINRFLDHRKGKRKMLVNSREWEGQSNSININGRLFSRLRLKTILVFKKLKNQLKNNYF